MKILLCRHNSLIKGIILKQARGDLNDAQGNVGRELYWNERMINLISLTLAGAVDDNGDALALSL